MLSHDEDRQLRAIEQWFEQSDPELTQMLRAHEAPGRRRQRKVLRVALDVFGVALFLFGLMAAIGAFMVFGVLILGAGACWHMATRGSRSQR
jgi:DUF3040 family protein